MKLAAVLTIICLTFLPAFNLASPVWAASMPQQVAFSWSMQANGNDKTSETLVEGIKPSQGTMLSRELVSRLNNNREYLGRNIFSIIHPHGIYDYTEPILMAETPGHGMDFVIPIHWHRHFGPVDRNHLTEIRWEIRNNHHAQAKIVRDDSTFKPTHLDEMNDALRVLIEERYFSQD